MKHRNSALVLLLVLMAGALTGCRAKDSNGTRVPPEDQIVITFAYPHYLTAFNKANYSRLADAFNAENPDLRVELREISTRELREKDTNYLDLIFDEELGADVFLSRCFRLFLSHEQVLNLDPLVSSNPEFHRDDFYPLAVDMLQQDGGLWGIPSELDLVVVYFNKELFDQAGVAYPTTDWTRDEFLDTAVALRQGLPEREMAFAGQVDEAVPFIYAHGGAVKEEDDYALTAPPTVEAVRWFANLALVYGVMPLPERLELYEPEPEEGRSVVISSSGEGEVPEAQHRWSMIGAKASVAAQEGDAALWSGLLSVRQGTGGWNWGFDWGIVPWPRDREEIIIGQAFAYYISANTPHAEAALRWVDFLTRQPPQLKGIPARRSMANSEQVRRAFVDQIGAEAYDACLRLIDEATPVDYGTYLGAEHYLGQAMLEILENGVDVETALTEAQAALEAER
jgi:ABC-type glycerol-3-phosphate transport system substrate-binding protein